VGEEEAKKNLGQGRGCSPRWERDKPKKLKEGRADFLQSREEESKTPEGLGRNE